MLETKKLLKQAAISFIIKKNARKIHEAAKNVCQFSRMAGAPLTRRLAA